MRCDNDYDAEKNNNIFIRQTVVTYEQFNIFIFNDMSMT